MKLYHDIPQPIQFLSRFFSGVNPTKHFVPVKAKIIITNIQKIFLRLFLFYFKSKKCIGFVSKKTRLTLIATFGKFNSFEMINENLVHFLHLVSTQTSA